MSFNYYGSSDIGLKLKIMEDYFDGFVVNQNVLFLCIADGLGSTKGSDVASVLAVEEFKRYMINNLKSDRLEDIEKETRTALYMINRMIFAYQRMNPEVYGNFTSTFTVIAINEKKEILISHLGNTRLYLFRNGMLVQMTTDNTVAMDMLQKREITEEEYIMHPDRNMLTKFLGTPSIEPFFTKGMLQTNDVILLVTNGVFEMLTNDQLIQILTNSENQEQACKWIIEGANQQGGVDNSAAILSLIDF